MYSRYPRRVAFIKEDGETLKVEFEYEVFEDVIKSAGIRPIIFVSIIGRYQQGKTTIISGINGNYGNVIGNGYRETTKGVYIDGPYDINYLYQRFNIKLRENIYFDGNELLTPLIFFFDIEGYDGKMHGIDNLDNNNKAYIEMCTPFLCLSSIYVFLSEPNVNVVEIKELFERVKVSKLTTYSNDDDSNGALQLYIVFNRFNRLCYNQNQQNVTKSIEEFQKTMKLEWIGVSELNKYGIKYEFYPILEALQTFYENGLFYNVFKYFVKNIVRSIENAAERKFVRSGTQSIKLFHYIIEHSNDDSFEEMIKLLIRSEHENSFETFSLKSYNETIKKIYPIIDKEFAEYQQMLNFRIQIKQIKNKYTKLGEELILKDLAVIQDHPKVMSYIEKLNHSISNKIDGCYIKLIKYRKKLIKEFNEKIEQKAEQRSSEILNQMLTKLKEENNFDFDNKKIQDYINEHIKIFTGDLIQFKKDENLFLLSNKKLKFLIAEKKKYFNNIIDKHKHNDILLIAQLKDENELKHNITKLFMEKMSDEYFYMEEQVMNNLTNNLNNISYYKVHYKDAFEIKQNSLKLFFEHLLSRKDYIMNEIYINLTDANESNSEIIERLKQKNEFNIDDDRINYLIEYNRKDLLLKIDQAFNNAKRELSNYTSETKKPRVSFLKREVKTRIIRYYPDDSIEKGEWKLVRTEYLSFSEIFSDVVETIFKPIKILHNKKTIKKSTI